MANDSISKHLADLCVELGATHKERDKHLHRADQATTTELKQARKERLLHHGQVCRTYFGFPSLASCVLLSSMLEISKNTLRITHRYAVQVHTQHEAAIKLMKEAKAAIIEFESASDAIQLLGSKLDTALRGLGDVENFLESLSVRLLLPILLPIYL